ncbi:putative vacuolar ATP synthase [Monocercomonoides exilis]|uniref:putative vacuolar ATP synthase n=1 Tax=Monocercomonoides exilis TaxID=2049356 RepID=UPI003559810F|nr:putative vacuolar ATP synthase [Monocercomonoides exilis]|eukprot:MONOS_11125.1-p1 / transcript=MONOS_11125.1 / gene=MONOS_11125 / organism=Monocercomonoides_exilis_PA203 / gene_product=V-type H / transcript_product=V-type H / location=Mono_scaffold00541:13668-14238(-) / protein_length=169 / sequence_SO=supercontig / SO=protein_coding / is_pseudo=false
MTVVVSELCPVYSTFFGYIGAAVSIGLANLGSCYGIAKAGVGMLVMGVTHPQLVMKASLPTILAGVLGLYGLIVSLVITLGLKNVYPLPVAFAHLSSGISVGLSCLAAGIAIGITGDAGVRAFGRQQKVFVAMMLVLIFAEALAIYGVIVSLILSLKGGNATCATEAQQ